ncbi:MAG: hypothetical protein ACF8R9_00240 [Phycisphaerales bacterium JB054]
MTEWWTSQDAALIGAIGGSAVGVLGGVFGTVVGLCAPKGIARVPVLGTQLALAVLGVVMLVAAVVALLGSQPYHVWFPLLLGGVLLASLMGGLYPVVRARYMQAEARRMDAEALRRG